jgi:YegS/Rv2252/BmrU family lipid kinase
MQRDVMKYIIILNPVSGRGNGELSLPAIQKYFTDENLSYEIVVTQSPGHAIEIAADHAADDVVVVSAGGDGTSNEVINGLMKAQNERKIKACMGVIPVGRGNDFAFSMGIPTALEDSLKFLTSKQPRAIDLGIAYGDNFPNGRYFGNGVGIGFDAVVGFEALKMKRLKGFASYLVAALKTIFIYYKSPKVHVKMDSDEMTASVLMVSIMNGIRMGGGFFMAPDGNPHDNKFDLCCVNKVSKLGTFPLISRFMQGTQGDHSAVRFYQSCNVVVTAVEGTIPAHADGETVCTEGKEVRVNLVPGALQLVC